MPVNAISANIVETIKLGKIKDVVIEIPIKDGIKDVVQPYRRVPAPLEKLVDDKINEILRQGIIKMVEGVSKWVSQLVCAPKDGNDTSICVDMRQIKMLRKYQ